MNPTLDAALRSWPYAPWLAAGLLATAIIYLRGWRSLARRDPTRWPMARPLCFVAGLAAFYLALASPLEVFADLLLSVHMAQHMLLVMVAPPLTWLGAPLLPILRGLPKAVRVVWVAPLLRAPMLRWICAWLVHPFVAGPLFVTMLWLWHLPRGYELALGSANWHFVEHGCFMGSALAFWFPVIQPFPFRAAWPRWIVFPYLILVDVQNTILAAWLAFSSAPIYRHYAEQPRLGDFSVLADQQLAGVLMWVPGSIALLVPLFAIGIAALGGTSSRRQLVPSSVPNPRSIRLPVLQTGAVRTPPARRHPARVNLLEVPILGKILGSRFFRPTLQFTLFALAVLVVIDGLFGPQLAPANLAGVAPWTHWRGIVVLGLVAAGNVSCLACPFTLPRWLARRWLPAARAWPRALRSKWLAVILVALFLWSYEAFSLWDSPWLTAWIVVAYFAAALAVDGFFRGAAFCKYVCPIGQFNFVQSLVSPLEVAVREPATCAGCTTRECIRGSDTVEGCGMHLFQPHKQGNLDCTFCLQCVQACPQDNVGLLARVPLGDLVDVDRNRSGIGRLSRRPDLAVLVVVLVFGAFANAAGMIAPVVEWQDAATRWLGLASPRWVITLYYLASLVVLPALFIGLATAIGRGAGEGMTDVAARYAYTLVPIGFAMWLAHYSFHFFTSYGTIVPVAQRMAIDSGLTALGQPDWQRACCAGVPLWLVKCELTALGVGLLTSLHAAYRLSLHDRPHAIWPRVIPWAMLTIALFALGVWIVLAPMQMRGTLGG